MEKVFVEVNQFDQRCYQELGLSEDILMEHAAMAMANHISSNVSEHSRVLICCGPGNNGADGIALARLLAQRYTIELYLPFGAKSAMAKKQLIRAQHLAIGVQENLGQKVVKPQDVIVDCLFGSGLARQLNDAAIKLIEHLNHLNCYKICCDIPTGINASGQLSPVAFNSDITITMGGLKTALFSDCAKDYVGTIEIADLGLPRDNYQTPPGASAAPSSYLLESSDLKLPLRSAHNSHKGSYGHLAVYIGDKPGAGTLSALAGFNFGCGLVTAIDNITTNVTAKLPLHIMQACELPITTSAIAIGMGLGQSYWQDSDNQLVQIMNQKIAKVIDADLCYWPKLGQYLDQELVITPHPKEFCALLKLGNLADISVTELQLNRFKYARLFGEKYPKLVLLLKGSNSLIAHGKEIYINSLGSAILSKGGSGDVLSGFIAALLAQGCTPLDAAIGGSLAHTLAAQRCQNQLAINNYGMTPQDLIEQVRYL